MRAVSQIHRIHPAAGVAWRPATSASDIVAPLGRAFRRWKRHSTVWRTAVCVVFGHEKWTTMSGDWACMRCGKVKCLEVPTFPASSEVRRSEMSALPRFGG